MATDPNLLRIGGRSGLSLETTPGSISTPGELVGGQFQVGAPSQQVGISGEESLYGTLSEIAGNLVQSVNTAAKINRFIEDKNWQEWLDKSWQGPESIRTKLLDVANPPVDPVTKQPLNDEQVYLGIKELLDRAPGRGINTQRKSELFGSWLQEDPDRRNLFRKLATRFDSQNQKLNPNDRLLKFSEQFNYFVDAQVPEALQVKGELTKAQLEYNTGLALTSARTSTLTYLANFELVMAARQAEKLGSMSLMQEAKKLLGEGPEFQSLIAEVDEYLEKPTRATLNSRIRTILGITKTQGDVFDTYTDAIDQMAEELTNQFQPSFSNKNIEFRDKYDTRMFSSAIQILGNEGFTSVSNQRTSDMNITETALKKAEIVTAGATNSTPERAAAIEQGISVATIQVGIQGRLDQASLVDYHLESWQEAWTCLEPSQKRYIIQNNLLGSLIDPNLSMEEQVQQTEILINEYRLPEYLLPKIKKSLLKQLESTKAYELFLGTQQEGIVGTLPVGNFEIKNSTTIADALREIRKQNGFSNTGAFDSLQSLFEIGLGQELFEGTTNGSLLWIYGLGLPPEDYSRWVDATQDPSDPKLKDIVDKYNVKKITRYQNQQEWIGTEPTLLMRSQNAFMRKVLDKFYTDLPRQFDTSEKKLPGIFTNAQVNDLATTGNLRVTNQTVGKVSTDNLKARGVNAQLRDINSSVVFSDSVTINGVEVGFGFPIPVGTKDALGTITYFHSQANTKPLHDAIIDIASRTKEEIDKQKLPSMLLSQQSLYSQEQMFRQFVVRSLFSDLVVTNPVYYAGTGEDQQQQLLALQRYADTVLKTELEYSEFYNPQSTTTTGIKVTGFSSPDSTDNQLATISLPTRNGRLTDEGTQNFARLGFMVATGRYEIADIKKRLQDSLSILGNINDGESLATRLEDNPEQAFFFTAVMNGLLERAARRVQTGELAQTSMDSAIQAEIATLVDNTDSKSYAGFLRAYAIFLAKANESTLNGSMPSNFRTSDPNETMRLVGSMDDLVNSTLEGEELVRIKGLQTWLNVALVSATPQRELEEARVISGPGYLSTTQTQRSNPLWGIRTLYQAYPQSIQSQMTGEMVAEKTDRELGIQTIISSYEAAGVKFKGNSTYEKWEELLIQTARMVPGGVFQIGRAPQGGPETAFIMNALELGGGLEDEYFAEEGTGLVDELRRRQNLGSNDPTNALFTMHAALGPSFKEFLDLVVPGLAKQGSVSLENIAVAWEDYRQFHRTRDKIPVVSQRTAIDETGINERIYGEIQIEYVPPEMDWLASLAYAHSPIDFGTRDTGEIEQSMSWTNPFGINDTYQEPTIGSRLEAVSFNYLFGPRDVSQRTQEAYERDIRLVLEHFNSVPGRFRTQELLPDGSARFIPGVEDKIRALATQLVEENSSYGRRLKPNQGDYGTLTNAYLFSEVKRVFFGDSVSDKNEEFLPQRTTEAGLLAGNRQAHFSLRYPTDSELKARRGDKIYPVIRQYHSTEGAVTKDSGTISLGLPVIPELMPYHRFTTNSKGRKYLEGLSSDALEEMDSNLQVMGLLYTGIQRESGLNFGGPGTGGGAPSLSPSKSLSVYSQQEVESYKRNPWLYIRNIKTRTPKVPTYRTNVQSGNISLPPTPVSQ